MPRAAKPPRLYLRKDDDQWIIRDAGQYIRTGCRGQELARAAEALEEYLSNKAGKRAKASKPENITVGEVLAKYVKDRGPKLHSKDTLFYSVKALSPFWANLPCSDVIGDNCRLYEKKRMAGSLRKDGKMREVKSSTIRRELGVLQSALRHAKAEGMLDTLVEVTLSEETPERTRWLRIEEAARLVRVAPPHLRRFILISLYTGRRTSAVLELDWQRVDFIRGKLCFLPNGTVETNKRRGQCVMPRQLLRHMQRWHRLDKNPLGPVVSIKGKALASIKTAFKAARIAAGLGSDVTPHTLKHTAITWAMQHGITLLEAAEFFDTTQDTLQRYWHHSPYHQRKGREAVEKRGRRNDETVRDSVRKRGLEPDK